MFLLVNFMRDRPKVNVWCALIHDRASRLFYFFFNEATVTWNLGSIPRHVGAQCYPSAATSSKRMRLWSPLPARRSTATLGYWGRHLLDRVFPQNWIDRDGPTACTPRSPDLTPPFLFLWGYVKDKVFKTPVQDIRGALLMMPSSPSHLRYSATCGANWRFDLTCAGLQMVLTWSNLKVICVSSLLTENKN
jgi:hypothetical protein